MSALLLSEKLPSSFEISEKLSEIEKLMKVLVSGDASVDKDASDVINASVNHLSSGGQRIRARLGLHASINLGLNSNDCISIAAAVELLHNASLVHDDLQDLSMLRRSKPTVLAIYGKDVALLSGDLLLSSAYAAISHYSDTKLIPEMVRLIHFRCAQVMKGQGEDILARKLTSIDISTYESIMIGKSGALLSLPIELALLGSGNREFINLAHKAASCFGIGYQIVDDFEDIDEDGSFSLNVIAVLNRRYNKSESRRIACDIGLRNLDLAISFSKQLPKSTGELLMNLAQNLRTRLEIQERI
jgi:geranylgeranyl pyrophosphate synthase